MSEEKKEDKTSFTYAFKQQVMKAWQPVPTINSTIILFISLTIFFLVFGIVLISYSNQIKEYTVQYDDKCQSLLFNGTSGQNCTVNITVSEKMVAPVFVYYELENFYQNHRLFVKSRNVDQLQGSDVDLQSANDSCFPVTFNKDIAKGLKSWDNNTELDGNSIANPCGLIAKNTFDLQQSDSLNYFVISSKNIAWPSDKEYKYKRNINSRTQQYIDVEDERFMVWMRTAALPYFRKLWGRIETDVAAGTYIIQIQNRYNVAEFQGKKYFVLSTANAFGGKNSFLAIAYLVVGCICFLITVVFVIKKQTLNKPQQKEDKLN